jgi:SNF2 family DNA or RNA helicase
MLLRVRPRRRLNIRGDTEQVIHAKREPSLAAKYNAFEYQTEAVDKIAKLDFGAIFHEQGLGKTKIALDVALRWLSTGAIDSVLICTKKHLINNWRDESIFHTFIHPRLLTQDHAANFRAFNSPARLYLTHYEVLASEQSRLKLFLKTRRVAVFLDEAQKIKNPSAKVTEAAFALRSGFSKRVILTGTPIANRPYDIWSLIYFLDGGVALGSDFATFKKALDLDNRMTPERKREFESALGSLHSTLAPFSVRETKQSSRLNLPAKNFHDVVVDLEYRQREIYDAYKEELRRVVVRDGRPVLDDADEILKRLLRLVQIAANPFIVDESYRLSPGKFPALLRIIEDAVDAREKVIVWTSFIKNAEWLGRELSEFGCVIVHGRVGEDDRKRRLNEFKSNGDTRLLVATPGAAKEGLTLTVANHAVFFDRVFSLDDYLQAQDRIHRISQVRECHVYNILARDTIDEWVASLIQAKSLAAQFGQGDVSARTFLEDMSYEFGDVLTRILN